MRIQFAVRVLISGFLCLKLCGAQLEPGETPSKFARSHPLQSGHHGNVDIPKCTQEFRELQDGCFKNVGYDLSTADAIIQNRTSDLPPNTVIVDNSNELCNKTAEIVKCIVPPILNKRGHPPCTNHSEFNLVEGEVLKRLTSLKQYCGKGTLMQKPCIRNLEKNMRECNQEVGLNKDMFKFNGTVNKGAVIGIDEPSVQQYCGVKKKLFDCQRRKIKSCEGADNLVLVTGYDHDAIQKSVKLLCDNTNVYLDGLHCFRLSSELGMQCNKQTSSRMLDLAAKKIKDNMTMDSYYDEYCKIRIDHLVCEIKRWKKKCSEAAVGLKNEYECIKLPSKCEKHPELQDKLKTQICAESAFYKQLRRNGANCINFSYGNFIFAFILSALFKVPALLC